MQHIKTKGDKGIINTVYYNCRELVNIWSEDPRKKSIFQATEESKISHNPCQSHQEEKKNPS